MITDRWTDKANFTVFLSNAATLTSLVLGVIAIFYSIIANADLSKSLGNIGRVSDEIVASRQAIGDYVRESQSLAEVSKNNAEALKGASTLIAQDIGHLEQVLESLRSESQQLKDSVVPIPARIDELAAKLAEAIPAAPAQRDAPQSTPTIDKEMFLRRASITGIVVTYGLVLANKNKKIFDCDEVSAKLASDAAYIHGFSVALHTVNAINNKPVEGKARGLNVSRTASSLSSITFEDAKRAIEGRNLNNAEVWIEHLRTIDSMLSTSVEPT